MAYWIKECNTEEDEKKKKIAYCKILKMFRHQNRSEEKRSRDAKVRKRVICNFKFSSWVSWYFLTIFKKILPGPHNYFIKEYESSNIYKIDEDTVKILTNDATQQAVYEGYTRYEIEGSIHAGGGKDSGFVPGSYQDHHNQTETQELVHDTEPGDITLLLAS